MPNQSVTVGGKQIVLQTPKQDLTPIARKIGGKYYRVAAQINPPSETLPPPQTLAAAIKAVIAETSIATVFGYKAAAMVKLSPTTALIYSQSGINPGYSSLYSMSINAQGQLVRSSTLTGGKDLSNSNGASNIFNAGAGRRLLVAFSTLSGDLLNGFALRLIGINDSGVPSLVLTRNVTTIASPTANNGSLVVLPLRLSTGQVIVAFGASSGAGVGRVAQGSIAGDALSFPTSLTTTSSYRSVQALSGSSLYEVAGAKAALFGRHSTTSEWRAALITPAETGSAPLVSEAAIGNMADMAGAGASGSNYVAQVTSTKFLAITVKAGGAAILLKTLTYDPQAGTFTGNNDLKEVSLGYTLSNMSTAFSGNPTIDCENGRFVLLTRYPISVQITSSSIVVSEPAPINANLVVSDGSSLAGMYMQNGEYYVTRGRGTTTAMLFSKFKLEG